MAFGIGSLAMSDFMQVPSVDHGYMVPDSYPSKAGGPTCGRPQHRYVNVPETPRN